MNLKELLRKGLVEEIAPDKALAKPLLASGEKGLVAGSRGDDKEDGVTT